ncbi:unnamed protein product [Prorocentrum cordatum]|uniref:Uncharacterized protein n=1 Tax=Prorocentrum cordatum TaxID=2364126 RepID=A0ABN9PQY6_9DINO|nr:unnamed protein product [Polarella glacialis]
MAHLVRPRSESMLREGGNQGAAKVAKHDEDEDKGGVRDHLMVQLEARVRALENGAFTTIIVPKEHVVIKAMTEAYADYLKERKDAPEKDMAGPAVQNTFAIVCALESYNYPDASLRTQLFVKILGRIKTMMEKSNPVELSGWIKKALALPCYERPGKDPRSRILLDLQGAIFVPKGLAEEDAVAKHQAEAVAAGNLHEFQSSPLELPTVFMREAGKFLPLVQIIAELLRHAGGSVTMSKAPRGNMARQLLGNKKK